MRTMMIGAMALLLAGTAQAQLLGGNAGVGATVGGVTGAVNGAGQVPNPVPQTSGAIDRAGADTVNTARDTSGKAARSADRVAGAAKPVHVDAGASVRVDRGTRCYYDDYTYDPVYRDGYYYCERTGPGAGARVSTDPH